MASKTIRVDYIARVEGESSLELHIRDGAVDAVRLSIFEPPRFFEALLRGRAPQKYSAIRYGAITRSPSVANSGSR